MKKKVLLSSILTIALCLSLIAGSTYALFTSETEANIAITAGKVSLTAGLEITKLESVVATDGGPIVDENGKTYEYQTATPTFANGGTAAVDGAVLTLTNITPGDRVTFDITGVNNSNVAIQYRYVIECLDGFELMKGLVVSVAGTEYEAITSYTSAWAPLAAPTANGVENMTDVEVSIALPVDAGNEYQEKSANIRVVVEAVQGNASVDANTAPTVEYVRNATTDLGANGLDGNGKTIYVVNEANDTTNYGVTTAGGTIENVTIAGESYEYNGKTYGFRAVFVSDMTEDLVINNATLKGTYALNVNSSTAAKAINVSNSTLLGWVSYGAGSAATFEGCKFGEANGQANIRPYIDTTFTSCEFEAGYTITRNTGDYNFTIVLDGCTVDGAAVTAANFAQLFNVGNDGYSLSTSNITVIVDGVTVVW